MLDMSKRKKVERTLLSIIAGFTCLNLLVGSSIGVVT
jgi:hypothetical protein